ncbi:Transposon Ty3-I Gag-Pol polyprotein [Araneus ventricosus]|uniref:Transposon Ty3-I Gag-Pol polyprotein n=1 Tax=Araneus ventricosus TaxID=182803 RepID=A0A4Y2MCA7_ARAVE|nr:Transposon Ty3-I Gag-Pol polyprotein [Araneus ventricosus]
MLVDTSPNVTLVRTDLAQKLKGNFIYTAPNIFLKTATGEKAEIRGKLDAAIECGSRKFQHRIYVADITDPCILGLDFLQKFIFTLDLEKNEIWTGGEEIPLFSDSAEHSKLCSVLAKEKTIIPARSECLIQGIPEVSGKFRYAVTSSPIQVSQKDVLVAATLVNLKRQEVKRDSIKDSYPLLRIDDTLDALNGSQLFTTLDLKSRYWQVEIQPEDKENTAFTTGQGLWQFKAMPFGLCNAPATFERLMEAVLRGLTSELC